MEYLMTYGWAILVVMIVGIVMWQLGIFNIGTGSTTAVGFNKLKPQLAAASVKSNGALLFMFTNGAGAKINIITIGIDDTVHANTCVVASNAAALLPNKSPNSGDNFRVVYAGSTCISPASAGDVYNANVRITYRISVGGIETTHTDSGSLRGPVEA
jgi:hypothetical protein